MFHDRIIRPACPGIPGLFLWLLDVVMLLNRNISRKPRLRRLFPVGQAAVAQLFQFPHPTVTGRGDLYGAIANTTWPKNCSTDVWCIGMRTTAWQLLPMERESMGHPMTIPKRVATSVTSSHTRTPTNSGPPIPIRAISAMPSPADNASAMKCGTPNHQANRRERAEGLGSTCRPKLAACWNLAATPSA